MTIQKSILGLALLTLFFTGFIALPLTTTALADSISAAEPVQIAQSDEGNKKKKIVDDGEEDLGEDDC